MVTIVAKNGDRSKLRLRRP